MKVAKLLDVEVLPSHISTSHRIPKRSTTRKEKNAGPSPIIVRFINRDIQNKIYANRKCDPDLDLTRFSVPGAEDIYINENLMQFHKQLF